MDDLLPSLHGSYPASSLLRSSPSLASASVLSASWFCHLCAFPCHHRPGSQVPYESQDTSHAFYTPDIAWAVSRFLPYCSQSKCKTPVLMSSEGFFRRFFEGEFALISRIHTGRDLPSRLLTITFTTAGFKTAAAYGGLKPPPTRRPRRAHLHLSYSTTLPRLLDTVHSEPLGEPSPAAVLSVIA